MGDEYFKKILQKYAKGEQHHITVGLLQKRLEKVIKLWAGNCLKEIKLSGSYAKNTQTALTTDFDLFVSLTSSTKQTPKEIFNMLLNKLSEKHDAKSQNVSIRITIDNYKVDIVPAKNHSGNTNDHWLYSKKKDSIIQTNVHTHINYVNNSNRNEEIKITKIWSKLHNLEFPSFYLELAVIEALKGRKIRELDLNFQNVLKFLSEELPNRRFIDPANSNNVISEQLTSSEKNVIAQKAKEGYEAGKWGRVIW